MPGAPPTPLHTPCEYALFAMGDLQLESRGIGHVSERGYTTRAGIALSRLETLGATSSLADRVAALLRGELAERFGRGASVQRHASSLPTWQLLRSSTTDYRGDVLDLTAIAIATGRSGLAEQLQILGLAALLIELDVELPVELLTAALTRSKGPGFRSFIRPKLSSFAEIPDLLLSLAQRRFESRPPDREAGPTAGELQSVLLSQAPMIVSTDVRAKLERTAKTIKERLPRKTGPLADPELDALDSVLDHAQENATIERSVFDGVLARIDAFERAVERSPATTYLRLRLAFVQGTETALSIAERTTALAMSMSSFAELEVLAAEAWLKAGQPRRALPFAKDVMQSRRSSDEARHRAAAVEAQIKGELARAAAPEGGPPIAPNGDENTQAAAPRRHSGVGNLVEALSRSSIPPTPKSPDVAPGKPGRSFPPIRPIEANSIETRARAVEPMRAPESTLPEAASSVGGLGKPGEMKISVAPDSGARRAEEQALRQIEEAIARQALHRNSELRPEPTPISETAVALIEDETAPGTRIDPSALGSANMTVQGASPRERPPATTPDAQVASVHVASDESEPLEAPLEEARRSAVGQTLHSPPSGIEVRGLDGELVPLSPSQNVAASPQHAPSENITDSTGSSSSSQKPPSRTRTLAPHERFSMPEVGHLAAPVQITVPPPTSRRSRNAETLAQARPGIETSSLAPIGGVFEAGSPTSAPPTPVLPGVTSANAPAFAPRSPVELATNNQAPREGATAGSTPQVLEMSVDSNPMMRGASMPPTVAGPPLADKRRRMLETPLEHLDDPPGASPIEDPYLPRNNEEARSLFTRLTRELGRDTREVHGVTLNLDLASLERVQVQLLESFPSGTVRTPGEARQLRRHGAYLSELLARRLGARWVDVASPELGHWKMLVEPEMEVWPFGRVIRFVQKRNQERDLVAYFLELELRKREAELFG
jgi:hypothetical protein